MTFLKLKDVKVVNENKTTLYVPEDQQETYIFLQVKNLWSKCCSENYYGKRIYVFMNIKNVFKI